MCEKIGDRGALPRCLIAKPATQYFLEKFDPLIKTDAFKCSDEGNNCRVIEMDCIRRGKGRCLLSDETDS